MQGNRAQITAIRSLPVTQPPGTAALPRSHLACFPGIQGGDTAESAPAPLLEPSVAEGLPSTMATPGTSLPAALSPGVP